VPIHFAAAERIKSPGGDTYVVDHVLNEGVYAHSARARSTLKGGGNVFLKRYFTPTKPLPWYDDFVRHQKELKRRIAENDSLRQYCYEFIDFFEGTEGRANKTFHQVFEFIENGKTLTKFIDELEPSGASAQWDQRVSFARVMMMGISALHTQRIVHTDLKPDNLLLVPNPHVVGQYHLRIIDLDWSIFSDQHAPWHGIQAYVGSPMYQSPEHLTGVVPDERSDVFTCALMLGELLCGGHPFAKVSNYEEAAMRGSFDTLRLTQAVPKVRNTPFLEDLLNRALDPNPVKRPTAVQLRDALLGRGKAEEEPLRPPSPSATPSLPPRHSPPVPPARSTSVQLEFDGKTVISMQIDTMIGRALLKPISADAQFASESQFRIHRASSGVWMVSPVAGTQNATIVDGVGLMAPTPLCNGTRIAIGNSSKGIEKLPLTVRLV
jgi:eukaryotic-like serine/threonine-protein kinase